MREAEPVAREMVLQIPRGVHAEVPKQSDLWEYQERNREDSAASSKGSSLSRGTLCWTTFTCA
jgi:hypothetical protein